MTDQKRTAWEMKFYVCKRNPRFPFENMCSEISLPKIAMLSLKGASVGINVILAPEITVYLSEWKTFPDNKTFGNKILHFWNEIVDFRNDNLTIRGQMLVYKKKPVERHEPLFLKNDP